MQRERRVRKLSCNIFQQQQQKTLSLQLAFYLFIYVFLSILLSISNIRMCITGFCFLIILTSKNQNQKRANQTRARVNSDWLTLIMNNNLSLVLKKLEREGGGTNIICVCLYNFIHSLSSLIHLFQMKEIYYLLCMYIQIYRIKFS